jgi:hypothetical protein
MQLHTVNHVLHKHSPENLRLSVGVVLNGTSFCIYGDPTCRVFVYTGSSYMQVSLVYMVIFYVFS